MKASHPARRHTKTGSLLDTILHFCYDKTEYGLKIIIFYMTPTGNQKTLNPKKLAQVLLNSLHFLNPKASTKWEVEEPTGSKWGVL